MKSISGKSFFMTACLAVAVFLPSACSAARTLITNVPRIPAPSAGKALVNIHRTNFGGGWVAKVRTPLFDGSGTFLMDLPRGCECQMLCEPGQKTFITWFGNSTVCVVTADLAPDKTYDLVIDSSLTKIIFVPFSKDPAGRKKLEQLEKRDAKKVFRLERDQTALDYESAQKAHIELIKRDFLGGGKSDRVVRVGKDDCR